jgi:general secretion pathway protein J
MSGKKAEHGFTLIELLIAITILSLILVALSDGLHFAGSAWRKQEEQISRQGDINAVQTVLRQMLASGRGFAGSPQTLKFTGEMPTALERGGLYDIVLGFDGDRLALSWKPHFKGGSADLQQNETSLLEGVTGFDLAYHSAEQGWQQAWDEKSKSLDMIAIKIRLTGGRAWPTLVIAPVINPSSQPKA